MAFKRIMFMDIYEIIRRWHASQSISHIARALGYDRKTIKKYIRIAQAMGLSQAALLPEKQTVIELLAKNLPTKQRPQPMQKLLLPFVDEISQLINDKYNPLKPKHAFEVICARHDLTGKVSYSTFKNFFRQHLFDMYPHKTTCRIETPPGKEIQIDYARVGYLFDPATQKRRQVFAFIATLAFSRHKFIQFTFKQDQASFIESHIRMFEAFGGVSEILTIDNLKNGVIKPDRYDPTFNRTYQELAEHYGFFINTCRVYHPKDKGKIERDVPFVRGLFRKLLAIHPNASLNELNKLANQHIRDVYGQKKHGTTSLKPYPTFLEHEKPALKPLPKEPFEIAIWKKAKVHPDLYVQFKKKYYSVPYQYAGKYVMIRATSKIIQIFYQHQLIKQHLIPKTNRQTDFNDFPPNVRAALQQDLPQKLQNLAAQIGPYFHQLIRNALQPHVFLNLRKAQGLIALSQKFEPQLIEQTAQFFIENQVHIRYDLFKTKLQQLQQSKQQKPIPVSQQSLAFVRELDYFSHPNNTGGTHEQ